MPEITEIELKRQIDKLNFNCLYMLYGEEKFLVKGYAEKLIKKAAGEKFLDFNLQQFDGDTASVDEIAEAVEALPFMAERKCVSVSDFNVESRSAQEMEKWKELLENLPSTTVLVLLFPSLSIDYKKSSKWRNFINIVNKSGYSVLFKTRDNAELEKLLCTLATKHFCELSRQNAAYILLLCGKDLHTLYNEMDKLFAYVQQGEITQEIIDKIIVKNMETTVFILSKAIISRKYDEAYKLLDQLFYQNEDPIAILSVLSSSYIDMYRMKSAVQSGQDAKEVMKSFEYKGKEFRLKNAERDGKRFSIEMLRNSLLSILETDINLKSSRTNKRVLMEKLIAELLLIAEGERLH